MTKLTRRGLLGSVGGLAGLAACAPAPGPEALIDAPDTRTPFAGEVRYSHGVASGDPLSDRVILWTRITPVDEATSSAIPIKWTVFADEAQTQAVASGLTETSAARDFTVKVDASGLKPGREYFFRFVARTAAGDVISPVGRTKTTAESGDAPVKFAFVSCSNYPFGRFHIYREIANTPDLDCIIHLGDYLYEYGLDGYGASVGREIGRNHEPPLEIVTLGDYRIRHAQYKSDEDLQAAHAAAPWLCTWDDHESTNNSYRTGAQNHNPEENEGNWTDRKQAAVQAYLEWMPVRDPEPGRAKESIYRSFNFGDVASITCLESRLTGRSDEISWFTELGGKAPEEVPMAAAATMVRVNDESRTMLGDVQEKWLAETLKKSAKKQSWQVLANQVVMAKVRPPNLTRTLTPEQQAAQEVGYIQQLIPFSQLGLPFNLDAWDGFPAARERLYADAKATGARLVTLTGDTHTAWANTLYDSEQDLRGVEFGCSAVTSPGLGTYFRDVPDLGDQFAAANSEVEWYDPYGNGWTVVTLTKDEARADYMKISDVTRDIYTTEKAATFVTKRDGDGMTSLSREV
ncbi:MAG: alkaline phosphatase D family protein [Pseudomonadota bacterium]